MNIYLLQLVGKALNLLVMSIASMFETYNLSEMVININNIDKEKSLEITSTIVEYDTIVKYNKKIPSNTTNILSEGENGLIYQYELGSEIKVLKQKIDRIVEIGTGKQGEYNGILTLYGPDCETCDGRGVTYCPIVKGKHHNLITDGIYFEDKEYGKIRILAAALEEFPCGTIIEINNSNLTKTTGIVLDTGSGMINAYNNGNILLDLAHKTEKDLPAYGTNRNTKFSVKRWGW